MSIISNPLLFPDHEHDPDSDLHSDGMTLLDYFAGRSMQGMSSRRGKEISQETLVKCAYSDALAMLRERVEVLSEIEENNYATAIAAIEKREKREERRRKKGL